MQVVSSPRYVCMACMLGLYSENIGPFLPFSNWDCIGGGVQVGMGWQAGEVSLGYVYTER